MSRIDDARALVQEILDEANNWTDKELPDKVLVGSERWFQTKHNARKQLIQHLERVFGGLNDNSNLRQH